MNFELILSAINLSVMPAWALLILAPNWEVTRKLVHSMLYPVILGAVYVGILILLLFFGMGSPDGNFSSIEGIRALFSVDGGIVVGWAHYLVFDLFVGAWEARDAQRRGFSHWLLIPCLALTFMFGPTGLLLYLLLRWLTKKGGWGMTET